MQWCKWCEWEKAGKRQLAITSETTSAARCPWCTAAPTSPPPHHYTTTPLPHCTHTHTHRTKCTSNKTSPTWKRAICRNCVSLICVLPATSQLSLSSIHNTACRRSVKLLCKMFHGCNAKSSSSTTITITQGRNITYVHQMGYS